MVLVTEIMKREKKKDIRLLSVVLYEHKIIGIFNIQFPVCAGKSL